MQLANPPKQQGQPQSPVHAKALWAAPVSQGLLAAGGMQQVVELQTRPGQQPNPQPASRPPLHGAPGEPQRGWPPSGVGAGQLGQRHTGQDSSAKVVCMQPCGQRLLAQVPAGGGTQTPLVQLEPKGGQSATDEQVQALLEQLVWQSPLPSVSVPRLPEQAVIATRQYWPGEHSRSCWHFTGLPLLEPPAAVDFPELPLDPPMIEKPLLLEEPLEAPPLVLDERDAELELEPEVPPVLPVDVARPLVPELEPPAVWQTPSWHSAPEEQSALVAHPPAGRGGGQQAPKVASRRRPLMKPGRIPTFQHSLAAPASRAKLPSSTAEAARDDAAVAAQPAPSRAAARADAAAGTARGKVAAALRGLGGTVAAVARAPADPRRWNSCTRRRGHCSRGRRPHTPHSLRRNRDNRNR